MVLLDVLVQVYGIVAHVLCESLFVREVLPQFRILSTSYNG